MTGTIPMSWIRAIVSVTSLLIFHESGLQHPGEGLDEEVLAPHHALVDTELFALVVGAVLESPLPAGFAREELGLAQACHGRFGARGSGGPVHRPRRARPA